MASRWVVLKFGGTSVATRAAWDRIQEIAAARAAEGLRPLVVCSAASGVTSLLEELLAAAVRGEFHDVLGALGGRHAELAGELGVPLELVRGELEELERSATGVSLVREASPRVRARVLAMGELMATRLGAARLTGAGLATEWLDARELLGSEVDDEVPASRHYLAATCGFEPDPALQERLAALGSPVLLTQGYIARDVAGDTVVLGRGGSDTSAAYLAARLGAERCEIWTDVPGLYTANPRLVPEARLLRRLDYREAQEIASAGAKALHPRCILPLARHGIPLHLRSTMEPAAEGTRITGAERDEGPQVKAIAARMGILLVSMETPGMWQQVGFLAEVFACFRKLGLSIDLVSTSEMNVTVSLDPAANPLDETVQAALVRELGRHCTARLIGPCAAVSLVGRQIRRVLPRLGPALQVFDEQRIHLLTQAASDLNLTFVVDELEASRLVQRLHELLFEEAGGDATLGPAWRDGGRGPEAAVPEPWWAARRAELLAVAARRAPVYVYDAESLAATVEALRGLGAVSRLLYAVKANWHADVLRGFAAAGLGFECVSLGEVEHVLRVCSGLASERILFTPNFAPRGEYERALELGVRVTVDNLAPLAEWPAIFAGRDVLLRLDPGQGRGHHAHVRTAGTRSKFGIPGEQIDAAAELVARAGGRVVGLHAHAGSGILEAGTWGETALFLARAAEAFPDCRVLDLGGGLGVVSRPGQRPLDLGALDESLRQVRAAHPRFELWLEPGRFLVARAGVLLARVTQTKRKGDKLYVGVETGMNSLIRPALYGAWHEIVNLTRLDEPASETADVVGPICETGDVLGHARRLPPAREGDVLLVAVAGAYGRAMSSSYNLREPAGEAILPVRERPPTPTP